MPLVSFGRLGLKFKHLFDRCIDCYINEQYFASLVWYIGRTCNFIIVHCRNYESLVIVYLHTNGSDSKDICGIKVFSLDL